LADRVFVGLGSNVGDRLGKLKAAAGALDGLPSTRVVGRSPVYETSPVGPRQRDFLNAVVEVRTAAEPAEFLRCLQGIERRLGRRRRAKWGPREIDLDILFHGRRRVRAGKLSVPHPRLRERLFVLRPLADLAPRFKDPVSGASVRALLGRLTAPDQRIRVFRKRL
jgi:2-amino-4-hydroxy-6-hydroxymethyldihydropteridine diphosphokinase